MTLRRLPIWLVVFLFLSVLSLARGEDFSGKTVGSDGDSNRVILKKGQTFGEGVQQLTADLALKKDFPPQRKGIRTISDLIERLEWGIDKKATQKLFEGFSYVGEHPTKNGIGFEGDILGYPAFVVCYFIKELSDRDSLARVDVMLPLERPNDSVCKALFTSIRSDLTKFLGRTPHDVGGTGDAPPGYRLSKIYVWKQEQTVVTLTLQLEQDAVERTSPPISIGIGDAKNDPLSRAWDWLP